MSSYWGEELIDTQHGIYIFFNPCFPMHWINPDHLDRCFNLMQLITKSKQIIIRKFWILKLEIPALSDSLTSENTFKRCRVFINPIGPLFWVWKWILIEISWLTLMLISAKMVRFWYKSMLLKMILETYFNVFEAQCYHI